MPPVKFHFNVPDRLEYACRLARKAWRAGARMSIVGTGADLQRLDALLWTFSTADFITHARADAPTPQVAVSPILLCQAPAQSPHAQVLLNLGPTVPEGFERFERVIEIVSEADPQDRNAARQRWRDYQAIGLTVDRYDVRAAGG